MEESADHKRRLLHCNEQRVLGHKLAKTEKKPVSCAGAHRGGWRGKTPEKVLFKFEMHRY